MVEKDSVGKPKRIIIDADTPEGKEFLKTLQRLIKPKDSEASKFDQTNAIAGEQFNPRRSLGRGFQPQE